MRVVHMKCLLCDGGVEAVWLYCGMVVFGVDVRCRRVERVGLQTERMRFDRCCNADHGCYPCFGKCGFVSGFSEVSGHWLKCVKRNDTSKLNSLDNL